MSKLIKIFFDTSFWHIVLLLFLNLFVLFTPNVVLLFVFYILMIFLLVKYSCLLLISLKSQSETILQNFLSGINSCLNALIDFKLLLTNKSNFPYMLTNLNFSLKLNPHVFTWNFVLVCPYFFFFFFETLYDISHLAIFLENARASFLKLQLSQSS